MNERIRELAKEAGAMFDHITWVERDLAPVFDRFAELIVKECVTNIVHDTANWQGDEGEMAYYQGVQDAVKSIRKHFGEK